MRRRRFLTLVFPQERRVGLDVRIRFFIWCEWLRCPSGGPGPPFAMERLFLAPHLPFSVVPRQLAQRLDVRLTPLEHEAEVSRLAGELGLADAEPRLATLRFVGHLTTPRRSDHQRTFGCLALLPGPATAARWPEPHLGANFLLENRLDLFLDYGRLRYRANPADPDRIQFDPNVSCGHLEYPGDFEPPRPGHNP
jgi:hypothetical protein